MPKKIHPRSIALATALAAAVGFGHAPMAGAHANPSEASSAPSVLPVAMSAAAPVPLLARAGTFTVLSVAASAEGSAWVLERTSDGVRASVRFAGHASAAVGAAVQVTAVTTGWVLSAAGAAIAFIPNELGRALLHNERVTR